MAFRKKIRLTIFSIGVFSLAYLKAEGKPRWIESPPPNNGEYHYYIGRSSSAKTEASAFSEATQDSYEQAIRENFGLQTKIQKQSYETASEASGTKRIEELSKNVRIDSFEKVEFWKEETKDNRYNVWVLFRYSNSAIKIEKQRLLTTKETEPAISFTEVEGGQQGNGAVLEIITDPPGAAVYIDGTPSNLLRTPIRLTNQLSTGKHSIRIDHPSFQSVLEEVIMVPKSIVTINKTLVKALGKLKVETDPTHANIIISGKQAGVSPTDEIEVPAGVPVLVEITHSETEKASQEVTVEKDALRVINIRLTQNPKLPNTSDKTLELFSDLEHSYKKVDLSLHHIKQNEGKWIKWLKQKKPLNERYYQLEKLEKQYNGKKDKVSSGKLAQYHAQKTQINAQAAQIDDAFFEENPEMKLIYTLAPDLRLTYKDASGFRKQLGIIIDSHKNSAPSNCFSLQSSKFLMKPPCMKRLTEDCSDYLGSENGKLYYYLIDEGVTEEKHIAFDTEEIESKLKSTYIAAGDINFTITDRQREGLYFCRMAAFYGAEFKPRMAFHNQGPWRGQEWPGYNVYESEEQFQEICLNTRPPQMDLIERLNEIIKKWDQTAFHGWKADYLDNQNVCEGEVGDRCKSVSIVNKEAVISYVNENCSKEEATSADLENRVAALNGSLRNVAANLEAIILRLKGSMELLKLCQKASELSYNWKFVPVGQQEARECHGI